MSKPLSKEEADAIMASTVSVAKEGGLWEKVCGCGVVVGGRFASYGKPTEEDMSRLACPSCGAAAEDGDKFTLRYVFGDSL